MAVLGQPSPRKVVPLSDVTQLVESLGDVVSPEGEKTGIARSTSAPNITDSTNTADTSGGRKRALTASTAFNDVLNELVATERSYVSRLKTLKLSYADPLRKFAKKKEEAILPLYEAKTLFGNIDAILPANEAFLADLEQMMTPEGPSTVGGVGDVALRHIRDLRAFDCYKQYYAKREEAQVIFEREMTKKSSTGFAGFIERTKYSTESKNRVGLRELLMEPIQRIPRYTLMFRTMIKHMAAEDPQRAKLIEADELASKIALAETDEQTKRATVMYCLERSIDNFPPNLISNNRTFIDCIDVEDTPTDVPGSSYPNINEAGVATATGPLHCTLFLFDDRLLIVKRPNGSASGRSLSGLDELERTLRTSGLPTGIKKVMSCKGVVEVTDVVATDVGGGDFHMYIETPMSDQYSDRWANRPFRSCSVVHPPSGPNYDPGRSRSDKIRFLENLWNAQAFYRCKDGRSVARLSMERELSGKSLVRTWFNIYERMDYLKEPKKNKLIVHIDPFGDADPLLFGQQAPPYVIARVQPMAGEVCRYTVTSSDPNDEDEEDIVHTPAVPARIIQTIHQFGLFKFRTGRNSAPSTPSASGRSKAAIFGLDAISRNLFNSTSDVFGSMTSSRRPKSVVSRSSTVNTGTSGMTENSLKSSQRSTSTGGTSFLSVRNDDGPRGRADSLRPNKLRKRSRSPGAISGAESGSEMDLERRNSSSTGRSAQKLPRTNSQVDLKPAEDRDDEEMVDAALGADITMDESEWDLSMRLELARKNSQSQEVGKQPYAVRSAFRRERTISEDHPMEESASTAFSTQAHSGSTEFDDARDASPPQTSIKSHPDSLTPTPSLVNPPGRTRSIQSNNSDRRPMGPRNPAKSPSPSRPVTPSGLHQRPITPLEDYPPAPSSSLPRATYSRPTTPTRKNLPPFPSANHALPPVPPMPLSHVSENPTIDELERAVSPVAARRSLIEPDAQKPLPQPSASTSNAPAGGASTQDPPVTVQPLAIKKKASVRRSSPPTRKSVASPLERGAASRQIATQIRKEREAAARAAVENSSEDEAPPMSPSKAAQQHSAMGSDAGRISALAQSTREDLEAGHRAVKRIRLEVQALKVPSSKDPLARVRSPGPGIPRSPQSRHIANKAAEARMEEMRQMIQSRNRRPLSAAFPSEPAPAPAEANDETVVRLESLTGEADRFLERASKHQADFELELSELQAQYHEEIAKSARLEGEVGRAKRQCDLVKKLLADATAENEVMYEAFNEELDGMYNDASLPDDEAWVAMANDLQKAKEARNEFSRENSALKRRLEEVELQNREWETLLRDHGLIP
ncbi:hypothetical protein FS837_005257 [Tulasnella sp. UAMH 9824]|nr:hypothetical protein FS837_005257 [Tulasnella sp. UAMH 9824]